MKENYKVLASREIKQFCELIREQFGCVPPLFETLAFIQGKEKIYALTHDADLIDLNALHINSIGLYIAEVKNGQLRLSIEGARLVGPHATKNIHDVSRDEMKEWFLGKDLAVSTAYEGFVILRCGTDYIGSGKYKEGIIMNFVPKARRLGAVH